MSTTETLERLARGETVEFRWLSNGQDEPDGWRVAEQRLDTHHNDFARLLVRVKS
jgi:hypothetical protein